MWKRSALAKGEEPRKCLSSDSFWNVSVQYLLACTSERASLCCCFALLIENTLLHYWIKLPQSWRHQQSMDRYPLLCFQSGVIYSLLMLICVLLALLPCEISSIFTSLVCPWLCFHSPSPWGLLSAFLCIPHWFGLVCELGRPQPGLVQSESSMRLPVTNGSVSPLWLFSEPEEIKTVA